MGCTQSNAAVVASSTNHRTAELKYIRINSDGKDDFSSVYPQAPNSNKSMNTAKTMTTNSTTTNSISNDAITALSPRIVPVLSYEIDDDDADDDFEVTTECDEESVQSMLLNSGRSKAAYSFFPDSQPSNNSNANNSPYTMMDEMSTDDNENIHDSRTYEEVPNMDESMSSNNIEKNPPVPCTILTVRKTHNTKSKNTADREEFNMESVSESSNQYHTRMLSIHQEQQKRLISLMTTLLPWTHAIVIRKQRHIQVRQTMMTSLLWFSMLLWPAVTHQFQFQSSSSSTSTTRSRNPTSLFRR